MVALLGFPSGDPKKELVEICSDIVLDDGRFVFILPNKPTGFLPKDKNGAFSLKIYRDKNKNKKRDKDEEWLFKPQKDKVILLDHLFLWQRLEKLQ